MKSPTAAEVFLPAAALEDMKKLNKVLLATSKYRMCIELTCGDKGVDAKLEDRAPGCIDGTCAKCGFRRLWSGGLRGFVAAEGGQAPRKEAPAMFSERVKWQNYAYRTKVANKTKKATRSRTSARSVRSSKSTLDEDENWELEKNRKELFLQARSGTAFAFLDELEAHLSKHLVHRSTLSQQKVTLLPSSNSPQLQKI